MRNVTKGFYKIKVHSICWVMASNLFYPMKPVMGDFGIDCLKLKSVLHVFSTCLKTPTKNSAKVMEMEPLCLICSQETDANLCHIYNRLR